MTEQAAIQNPVVHTTAGMVMGREKNGVQIYGGIPYAAAPVGERRFKRAVVPEPWDDILDATRFGPPAPQLPSGGLTNNQAVKWSEDCLFLNVTTPAADDSKRPVLVWIHGGAFRSGQGAIPWYNGTSFAGHDVVVVSVNYRLGALGFADLTRLGSEYETSGINGILDQILALEWVRDNIAGFGGDPERVTIAGESAGGFSVSTLLASERAQGLFHRAIPQSGAAHHSLTPEMANTATDLLLEELGVDNAEVLLTIDPHDLLKAQGRVDLRWGYIGKGVQAFYPAVGNEVLPISPLEAITRGIGKDVPVLTGTNKDENSLFVLKAPSDEELQAMAEAIGGESLLATYKALLPEADNLELAIALQTDFTFGIPCIRLAEQRADTDAETWVYQFDWESRAPHLKATHALEIPFMFNTLAAPGVDVFIGPGDKPQSLAEEMHGVWANFIKGEAPVWPSYDRDRRAVWHFDNNSALVENGEAVRLAAWEGIR